MGMMRIMCIMSGNAKNYHRTHPTHHTHKKNELFPISFSSDCTSEPREAMHTFIQCGK